MALAWQSHCIPKARKPIIGKMFKRFVYKAMLFSPAVMLFGIGVHARTFQDSFVPVGLGPQEQAKITSQCSLVSRSTAATRNPDRAVIVGLLAEWDKAPHFNRPMAVDDTAYDGVKSEIAHARINLLAALDRLAEIELTKGDQTQAASDWKLAFESVEKFKYEDQATLFAGASFQKHLLRRVQQQPLKADAKHSISKWLTLLVNAQQPLEEVDKKSRAMMEAGASRKGVTLSPKVTEHLTATFNPTKHNTQSGQAHVGGDAFETCAFALRLAHFTQEAMVYRASQIAQEYEKA